MAFKVLNPGVLSLLQDSGRFGYQHLGITHGGPMDEHAFFWANRILGNSPDAAQIEITFGQCVLEAHQPVSVALTGADLNARLNDRVIAPWCTYQLKPGDQLEFQSPRSGLRAYLAVADGFDVEPQLGSCSTVSREQLGGLSKNGEKLKAGDKLEVSSNRVVNDTRVPSWAIPDYQSALSLGVILGYQHTSFCEATKARFFHSQYTVSNNIDRMGYRLEGPSVKSSLTGITSEGIAYGAIQVPDDGQPIVLMKDRQTIGGYPKIGCLSALGAGKLAQRMPGDSVGFYPMDISEAEIERRLFNRMIFGC
ncbi:allophanate hydrolase [Veronia nyctiphanis]|uniref:Allophanate hydrolase n=1 Tax=Veronia nyctiphanis TaxID=1278244 RepID=A0A4Q0YTD8_9GAMM|nr:biotin-dependent carboxyltransferase family protein [Veronia nyctiphanis]RXJ74532.1 allophanate hydrolase [Veronia nyctiphanis]